MKVLVIGSGGREHAIAWKVNSSPLVTKLYCAPGNAGTSSFATNIELQTGNLGALALWAVENEIDLTIVGPEQPLAEGIVDLFSEHGLRIFGPTKAAAQLESSKIFAKELMLKAGVPTAKAEFFQDFERAKSYVESHGAPVVIKADGLAAGKGVIVAMTVEEAVDALRQIMVDQAFGQSGSRVLVEDFIEGREASVMAIVDGLTVLPLVVSQDFKRVNDGDQGPNTGGMGAISPTSVLGDKRVENLVGEIFIPVLRELYSRGIKYVGFLYAGVIVDANRDVQVLEFNCRLGDPETEVLLPRLQSDLLYAIDAATKGKLSSIELQWRTEAAACVVASSRGYPGKLDDGKEISGLFEPTDDLVVFQAGTVAGPNGSTLTKGGRVLVVSALGRTLDDALKLAYKGMSSIQFDGMHYRRDIGRTN